MPRPRVHIRTLMIVVAISALACALAGRWRRQAADRGPHCVCVDLFPIDPPALSKFADPYDPDRPQANDMTVLDSDLLPSFAGPGIQTAP